MGVVYENAETQASKVLTIRTVVSYNKKNGCLYPEDR